MVKPGKWLKSFLDLGRKSDSIHDDDHDLGKVANNPKLSHPHISDEIKPPPRSRWQYRYWAFGLWPKPRAQTPLQSSSAATDGSSDQEKHAIAVAAAATSIAAEAAFTAARAASAVVSLTSNGHGRQGPRMSGRAPARKTSLANVRYQAAVRIQTAFRGYLVHHLNDCTKIDVNSLCSD